MQSGAYARFLRGGGPNLKLFWILGIHVASSEPLLGGLGAYAPKKAFKNGAISCVLSAIFTFMIINPLKKL